MGSAARISGFVTTVLATGLAFFLGSYSSGGWSWFTGLLGKMMTLPVVVVALLAFVLFTRTPSERAPPPGGRSR